MAVKVRQLPLVAILAIAVLFSGGLYAISMKTNPKDQRIVRFYADWSPARVKAQIIQMGAESDLEEWRDARPTFDKTRTLAKGEIAVLDVRIPDKETLNHFSCRIKVGAEAPKFGVVEGNRCRVDKYLS